MFLISFFTLEISSFSNYVSPMNLIFCFKISLYFRATSARNLLSSVYMDSICSLKVSISVVARNNYLLFFDNSLLIGPSSPLMNYFVYMIIFSSISFRLYSSISLLMNGSITSKTNLSINILLYSLLYRDHQVDRYRLWQKTMSLFML